jgi:RNA polymerase sigma factor (sigma-70 family)
MLSTVFDSVPENSVSLAQLAARAHQGDRRAEATICERLTPAIRAFARRRVIGIDAINEFTQDVLVLLVRALREGTVRDPNALGGFALGLCRNLALERARRRERRDSLWAQYGADLAPLEIAPDAPSSRAVAQLEDCLSQLSRRARDVVRLSYVESWPHAEIAKALNVTENAARVLRHRTLNSLRDCMQGKLSWEAV